MERISFSRGETDGANCIDGVSCADRKCNLCNGTEQFKEKTFRKVVLFEGETLNAFPPSVAKALAPGILKYSVKMS